MKLVALSPYLNSAVSDSDLILHCVQVDVPDSSFLSILDMVALNLKLNRTFTSQADTIRMYNNHVAML